MRDLPFHAFDADVARLEIIVAATDLIASTKLLGFTDQSGLVRSSSGRLRQPVNEAETLGHRAGRRACLASPEQGDRINGLDPLAKQLTKASTERSTHGCRSTYLRDL